MWIQYILPSIPWWKEILSSNLSKWRFNDTFPSWTSQNSNSRWREIASLAEFGYLLYPKHHKAAKISTTLRIKLLLLKIQFYDPNFEQMLQGALNFENFFFSRLQGLMQRYKNNSLWPPQARKFKNSSYYLCAKITTSIPRKACFIFLVSVVN